MVSTNIYSIMDTFFNDGFFPTSGISCPSKPHNVYFSNRDNSLHFEVAAQNTEKENIKVTSKGQVLFISVKPEKKKDIECKYIVHKLSNSDIELEYSLHEKFDMKKVDKKTLGFQEWAVALVSKADKALEAFKMLEEGK